jgi:microcystin-dependent protein
MSEPFIAEIRIFAGNFAPRNWAFCNGQLLPIAQNTALFSLVGTTYGGDGRSTFGLPDLQDRAPMHPGNGPGLTSRRLGETGGTTTTTLTAAQMPSHQHRLRGTNASAVSEGQHNPIPGRSTPLGDRQYRASDVQPAAMHTSALAATGGSQPHNNMPPFLALNFIIALMGLYPSRS